MVSVVVDVITMVTDLVDVVQQGSEEVSVVVGGCVLQHSQQALQTQARVHAVVGEGPQAAVRLPEQHHTLLTQVLDGSTCCTA